MLPLSWSPPRWWRVSLPHDVIRTRPTLVHMSCLCIRRASQRWTEGARHPALLPNTFRRCGLAPPAFLSPCMDRLESQRPHSLPESPSVLVPPPPARQQVLADHRKWREAEQSIV